MNFELESLTPMPGPKTLAMLEQPARLCCRKRWRNWPGVSRVLKMSEFAVRRTIRTRDELPTAPIGVDVNDKVANAVTIAIMKWCERNILGVRANLTISLLTLTSTNDQCSTYRHPLQGTQCSMA